MHDHRILLQVCYRLKTKWTMSHEQRWKQNR